MYKPTWDNIKKHELAPWYDDVKLGIFIHWGLYSIPAYAPLTGELGDIPMDDRWFCNNPYAEWYLNSIRVKRGPTYDYHIEKYGKTFDYEKFADMWTVEKWNPSEWASLFRDSGAGYVVLTAKHHDGFCLWPTEYTDYNSAKMGPGKDLMGDLTIAVRDAGMKMGVYYSGLLDWKYHQEPIVEESELFIQAPTTFEYADYAANQVRELINRYKPSVFWNDIGWPEKGVEDLRYIFAHYYNTVEEGVVNDRWSDTWCDYTTKEYKYGEINLEHKWEMCRGLGYSFGYNQLEDNQVTLSSPELITLLVSTVSNNGNLLLNVGPKADGTIPESQQKLLKELGVWLRINGEAVYGTRPHTRQHEKLKNGLDVYFTKKDQILYLLIDNIGKTKEILIPGLRSAANRITSINRKHSCQFRDGDEGLTIDIDGYNENDYIAAFRIDDYLRE